MFNEIITPQEARAWADDIDATTTGTVPDQFAAILRAAADRAEGQDGPHETTTK